MDKSKELRKKTRESTIDYLKEISESKRKPILPSDTSVCFSR